MLSILAFQAIGKNEWKETKTNDHL